MDSAPQKVLRVLERMPQGFMLAAPTSTKLNDGTHDCEGSKFHSPTPYVLHEVTLNGESVHLCPTCLATVQVFQAIGPELEGLARYFGNNLRKLMRRGLQTDE